MHHLWNQLLLHCVNLILFTDLLVHLILRISPHHSHHLRCHHLSLPLPFTPDLKLISFTNPFLDSHSFSFRTAFMDLNLYWIKGVGLLLLFQFLATCARLSCILSFRVHVKLSSIVSYRIVWTYNSTTTWRQRHVLHWNALDANSTEVKYLTVLAHYGVP